MADAKKLPDDPAEFARFLRERAAGHAPGYDIAIYARPFHWTALANALVELEADRDKWKRIAFASMPSMD